MKSTLFSYILDDINIPYYRNSRAWSDKMLGIEVHIPEMVSDSVYFPVLLVLLILYSK